MSKTLTVYLAANLKDFNQGMNDAEMRAQGFGGTLNGVLGPAMLAAAAAAGAMAIKLGVDGVKAAAEDEAAMARLATTLGNLGLGEATEGVEAFIDSQARLTGQADSELRPAFDRLIRSTRNVEEAQKALKLAQDISVGTGKSLDSVVQSLGKAYDGNTTGLGRLGVGLDKAILATGDMNTITAALSNTFQGQAAASAQTYEGQLKRLQVAGGELQEAFGRGVLAAFGDTETATGNLSDAMQDLEPVLESVGSSIGTFAGDLIYLTSKLSTVTDKWADFKADLGPVGSILSYLTTSPLNNLTDAMKDLDASMNPLQTKFAFLNDSAYDALRGLKAAGDGGYLAAQGFDEAASGADNAARALVQLQANAQKTAAALAMAYGPTLTKLLDSGMYEEFMKRLTKLDTGVGPLTDSIVEHNRRTGSSASGAATAVEDSAQRIERAYESIYRSAETSLNGWMDRLDEAVGSLDEATQAVEDWATDMQDSLLSAFDIGAAYENSINKEGQVDGQAWIAGLTAQINKLDWFGNVLTELKRRGADPSLIQYLASQGADAGGAMGQAMIDQGIVPEMIGMSAAANAAATNLAAGMVPAFLLEAQGMASGAVIQLAEQVEASKDKLISIGKAIGKPVGAGFAKEISDAVADALEKAERTRSAAQARRQAEQASQAVTAITDQQVGQSLQRIINNSNARAGYASNAFGIVLG